MTHTRASPISREPLLAAALAYAEGEGLPVFPLEPHGKRPIVPHGFQAATRDPQQIRAWWSWCPSANIGIPTGQRSGLVVLDVDAPGPAHPQAQGPVALKHLLHSAGEPALPPTRMARTGGGGLHLLFAAPVHTLIPCTVGLAGVIGLDIKGEGGYFVAPPSLHHSLQPYRWLHAGPPAPYPAWLIACAVRPLRRATPTLGTGSSSWERLARFLAEHRAGPGTRNALGFWLACRLVEHQLPYEHAAHIMRVYASHVPGGSHPYTEREALHTLASALHTARPHLR